MKIFSLIPKLRYLLSINLIFTSLGFTNSKNGMKLMKRSKIILFICNKYIYSITLGIIIVLIISIAFNYNTYDFCIFGILWIILWTVWGLLICYALYWPPGYFSIVCYYLKLRIAAFRFKLINFKAASGQPSLKMRSRSIEKILREHNNLCIKISEYNKYWKIYLTISILIFIVIISFLSYLIFIARLNLFLRFEYLIILSAHLLLLFIITYSASSISHYNKVLFCDLYTFSVKNKLHIHSKLMVSNCWEKYFYEMLYKNFFLKLMSYIEKLANNKIGFTFINDVLITRKTFEFVSHLLKKSLSNDKYFFNFLFFR